MLGHSLPGLLPSVRLVWYWLTFTHVPLQFFFSFSCFGFYLFFWTKQQEKENRLYTPARWLQKTHQKGNKKEEESRSRVKERGPTTIPRPPFTNYTEYLLTGGLSQWLLSHPTSLIFSSSTSHQLPSNSLQFTACEERGSSSRLQANRGDKRKGGWAGRQFGVWPPDSSFDSGKTRTGAYCFSCARAVQYYFGCLKQSSEIVSQLSKSKVIWCKYSNLGHPVVVII